MHIRTLTIGALWCLLVGGCTENPDPDRAIGGKADDVACNAAELQPLGACVAENCGGLEGGARATCIAGSCEEALSSMSPECSGCVGGNAASSTEEIIAACATASFACGEGELTPLGACKATKCTDEEDVQTCVATKCGAELGGLSETCMGCLAANPGADVAAICAPPTFACDDGELTPLGVCKATECADAEDLQTCVATNCGAQLGGLSETCMGCLLANPGASSEEIATACAPPTFDCEFGELTPLGICKATNCAEVDPEEVQTCVFTNCAAELGGLSEQCTGCLTDNAASEDVAAICQAPAPDFVCESGELAPLVECAADSCAGLGLEHQADCLFASCQNSILAVSRGCMSCIDLSEDLAQSVATCQGAQ